MDGVQPTVPENPPPLSKESQKLESVDPISKLSKPANKDAAGEWKICVNCTCHDGLFEYACVT